jgi:transcriptional regulator with XRE-family HTH domain
MINHLLGRRIAEIRKARKFTQVALAAHLKINKRQLQNYEAGVSMIPGERIAEIASVLECGIAEFYKPPGSPIKFLARRVQC